MTRTSGPARWMRRGGLPVFALLVLAAVGCSKKLVNQVVENQAPEVRLTGAPIQADPARPDFYAYLLQWTGFDPDGRVDHFLYAVDSRDPYHPDPSDTTWHPIAKNESTFFFTAAVPIIGPDGKPDPRDPKSESPHVFAIYSVDNQGKLSTRGAVRAFFSFTQAPTVQITEPVPNIAFYPSVTPTTTIRWTGVDPDGQFTNKPLYWKFRLFPQRNTDYPGISDFVSFAVANPDSFRKLYAPDFRGWTKVGAETTSFQYRNLNPQSTYLFVVTGFDEAGAYDPVFSPERNMLKFSVTFAGTYGPIIRMFNQFFFYEYPYGGFDLRETRWFRLEIPSDQKVTFNWSAAAPPGADIRRYRWVMDLVDLTDETPRTNERDDWVHWSTWSLNTTSATIGPFPANPSLPPDPNAHLFYIEAEDTNGLLSVGILYFRAVRSDFVRDLLFVDDTRFGPDMRDPRDQLRVVPPTGPWPNAAELDSFLFAVGGRPWNSYPGWGTANPTLSVPGIFHGYRFDTLGTRGTFAPSGVVPLSILGHYKHIVWYTDQTAASYTASPTSLVSPISGLRLVSSPGRPVVLATYMTQGGSVWLCGGGAAMATLISWNKPGTGVSEYTSRNSELIPGRMMYDFVHWREGVQMTSSFTVRKFGTYGSLGMPNATGTSGAIPGSASWPRPPGRNWPGTVAGVTNPEFPAGQPDYSSFPNTLHLKSGFDESGNSVGPDPPPPLRNPDSYWYPNNYMSEYIHVPTFVREDYNDDPDILNEISTLDTLYLTAGGSSRQESPCMTLYHGRDNKSVIFSGFNIWIWKRSECIALVDGVLQKIWGLPHDGSSRQPAAAPSSARRAAP